MERRQLLSAAASPVASRAVTSNADPGETITLTPSTTFQTIHGWLGIAEMQGASVFQQTQALNMLVNDLGLTGLRLEAPAGNLVGQASWEATPAEDLTTFAKTGAPADPTYSAFNTASTDTNVTNVVIPFENLVSARQANAFTLYTSQSFYNFGGTGHIPTWMAGNPGEYAENLVSFDEYLKTKYGIVPTYMTILNEEDNGTHMTPALDAAIIRAVGPLLQKAGLSTKILAGETATPADVLPTAPAGSNFVSSLTPDDWRYIAGISYHDYGQTNAQQAAAYSEAQSQGVFASEDESTTGNALLMYNDLVSGSTSFSMPQYGMFGLGSSTATNTGSLLNGGIDLASIQPGESYFDFRQIMNYIRPGAVRIGDSSADSNIETMAFQNNGQITTVLINQANNGNNYSPVAKTMTITGLPNGTYGVSASIGATKSAPGTPEEIGVQTVTDGTLTLTDPANSVLTVYPRAAGVTLAPYIYQSSATDAGTTQTYLLSGAGSSATLKATAIDPQLDAMTYTWNLVSAPAGASVALVNPNSATATANGLSATGQYIFNVTANNGTTSSTRQVGFNVFSGPQQPIVEVVENRSPPSGSVPASIGPILHLPNETSTQLWAQLAFDLQGDAVTGNWTYVSGPAGASPVLTNENISGLPAGYIASNLTVAGNYDFRLTATDGVTAPVVQDLVVTVDAANPATSLTATNAGGSYVSPGNGQLKATVADTNGAGQWTSSWWDVVSQPAGSNVSFTDQTSPNTDFTVDIAGQYQFELFNVDQTLAATSSVVTVNIPSVPLPSWLDPASQATWNPGTHLLNVTGPAKIIADPGTDEPIVQASGSAAVLTINPTSGTDIHIGGLSLMSGASATVTSLGSARSLANYHLLVVGTPGATVAPMYNIDSTSTLDLADNDMAILYGSGTSPLATVTAELSSAYDNKHWDKPGLTSSVAKTKPSVTALGFGEASTLGVTTFDGLTLGGNALLVKYTLVGDTFLKGTVGLADYNKVVSNLNASGLTWTSGVYDYSNTVGLSDYNDVLANLNQTLANVLPGGTGESPSLPTRAPTITIQPTPTTPPTVTPTQRKPVARPRAAKRE